MLENYIHRLGNKKKGFVMTHMLFVIFLILIAAIIFAVFQILYGQQLVKIKVNIMQTLDIDNKETSLISFLAASYSGDSDMTYAEKLGASASINNPGVSGDSEIHSILQDIHGKYDISVNHGYKEVILTEDYYTQMKVLLPFDADQCDNSRVNSGFGYRGIVSGGTKFHSGIDFACTKNTVVRSVAKGTVVTVLDNCKADDNSGYCNDGYGNMVAIEHEFAGKRYYSFYAHLNIIYVAVNDKVNSGDEIAKTGNTGFTGCGYHLHFEIDCQYDPNTRKYPNRNYALNPCSFFATSLNNCEQDDTLCETEEKCICKCPSEYGECHNPTIPQLQQSAPASQAPHTRPSPFLNIDSFTVEIAIPGAIPGNVKSELEMSI